MPLQLHNTTIHTATEAAAGRTLRERAAAHHANTAASGRAPTTALPPPAALWVSGRERRCKDGDPGTDPANCARRSCQAAPGTHPDGGAGAVRWEGAGSRRKAPSPARTPDPAYSAGPAVPRTLPTPHSTHDALSDALLPRGCVPQFPLAEQRWLRSGPPPASPVTATPQSCRRSGLTKKLSHTNPIRPPQLGLCNGECVVMAMPPLATPVPSSPHCPGCCPTPQRARTPNTSMGRRASPSPSLTPLSAPRQDPLPAGVPNCTSSGL